MNVYEQSTTSVPPRIDSPSNQIPSDSPMVENSRREVRQDSTKLRKRHFFSILFNKAETSAQQCIPEAPEFFVDLNLDQIIDAITTGRKDYDLKPFFTSL